MQKNNLTIKTLICFGIFATVMLIILWIILILSLSYSYEKFQFKTIKNFANKLSTSNIPIEEIENYAYKNNICLQIYENDSIININTKSPGCILNSRSNKNNNLKKELIESNDNFIILKSPESKHKSIIVFVNKGDNNYIFLNTSLEDIGFLNNFMKRQIVYIILVLIILSIIVAFFISKLINKPILKIIGSARELEKGNYKVEFEKSGIAELDELSSVLTVAASEMNKTDQLKRDLIANVSHDLKTPLTMIKAYAEKIKDISHKDKEKMNKDLEIIINETNRLNILVNDLLDLSKLENNVYNLNVEKYDLVNEINNIISSYDIIKETEDYNFEVDMPEKIYVHADKSKINQVIYNLINNAIENVGDDLTIKISVKRKRDGVLISITNFGVGISDEDKSLIWNKYYKKDKNHKRNVVGSGIGLSIVKEVLDAHNYEYGIDSKIDEYTTFYFKIKNVEKK